MLDSLCPRGKSKTAADPNPLNLSTVAAPDGNSEDRQPPANHDVSLSLPQPLGVG